MNSGDQGKISFIDKQHPYAGLQPFQEVDKDYFFGRDQEIKELTILIDDNVLTVVFGKSGIGKTSLLQAGLIPWIRSNYYLPVYLRINFNDQNESPIMQAKRNIHRVMNKLYPDTPIIEDKTLWEYFFEIDISKKIIRPLLIFDQFEEIFTIEEKNSQSVNSFVTEIADLIENRMPVTVQERLKKEKQTISHFKREPNFRVIFSLREDYLAQLEPFFRYMPSIRTSRIRITQMKGENAIDAIERPAKRIIRDRSVALKIFDLILRVSKADDESYETIDESWETQKVEPFLLSLFCYQANEKRLQKEENEISMELIESMSAKDIVRNYYEENTLDCHPNVQVALENLLLTEKGNRKLQEKDILKQEYRLTEEDFTKLVNRRILRKETRNDVDYVELIHDVLADILTESRKKRKIEEKRKEEERKAAIRRKIIKRRIAVAFSIMLIVIALITGIAFMQKRKAELEKQRADEEKQRTIEKENQRRSYEWAAYSIDVQKKDPELSFRLAEEAFKKDENNLVARRALLSVFYGSEFYKNFREKISGDFLDTKSEKQDFYATFSPNDKKQQILTVNSNQAILWTKKGLKINKTSENLPLPDDLQFRPNAAFSPDLNFIAFCTKNDRLILVWDLQKEELKKVPIDGGVYSVAFFPGKNQITLITAGIDGSIRLFDLYGKLIKKFRGHDTPVISAIFSPNGKNIVSTGWDNYIRLWDINGMKKKEMKNKHPVFAASFSPGGKFIIIADKGGQVQLLNLDFNLIQTFGEHHGAVNSIASSPGGNSILTGSDDHTSRFFTVNNFLLIDFGDTGESINNVSFSPDGKYVLLAPAQGPAQLRPVASQEIIDTVNKVIGVRQLTEPERNTYNIPKLPSQKRSKPDTKSEAPLKKR